MTETLVKRPAADGNTRVPVNGRSCPEKTQISRRALIGGAGLAIVAGGLCAADVAKGQAVTASSTAQWEALVRNVERTWGRYQDFYRTEVVPKTDLHTAVYKSFGHAGHITAEEKASLDATGAYEAERAAEDWFDAYYAAVEALYAAPAPNMEAVAYKLSLFIREDGWGDTNAPKVIAGLLSDVRRLGGEA